MRNSIIFFFVMVTTITSFPQRMVVQKTDGTNIFLDMNTIETINFIIPCPGTPTVDYAGKIYNTVLIGNQCWLKENLDVGTMINGWGNQADNGILEKYCYSNDPSNCTTYGGLYQWYEAMQWVTTEAKGICPTGWHIPTLAELQTLAATVGNDGNALKEIGQGTGGGAGTNTSGFSALLAGIRHTSRAFLSLGEDAILWGSELNVSDGYFMRVNNIDSTIIIGHYYQSNGFSVRCLRD